MAAIHSRLNPPPPDYSGIREPTQQRSRERVRQIKDAAIAVLTAEGVHGLTPTGVAEAAGIPMPALYRYFDDIEAIVMSLMQDWEQRATPSYHNRPVLPPEEIPREPKVPLHVFMEGGILGGLDDFIANPHWIELFWRYPRFFPRVQRAVEYFNAQSARDMRTMAINLGILDFSFTPERSLFVVEMTNRVYQVACNEGPEFDLDVVHEGIRMCVAYMREFVPKR